MPFATSRRLRLAAILALGGCAPEVPAAPPRIAEPAVGLRGPETIGRLPDTKVFDATLHARLDEAVHRIDGRLQLRWHNRSAAAVDHIPLHLYMNAFRAEDTAWMEAGRGRHRGVERDDARAWGYVDVRRVTRNAPADARAAALESGTSGIELAFVEDDDPTLGRIDLDRPVAPGGSIDLDIEFVTQLPEVFARTGWSGPFHMVGQWYPKPGVLLADGTWKAHVFHFHSEFFSDFGDFDVHLDLPPQMIVGATGVLLDEVLDGERKRQHWHADMVHDFAWAADPRFLEYTAEHDGIRIRQLATPEHAWSVDAHLQAQRAALDTMQRNYGQYPWSTITIIHPPKGAEGAGGMEYPTLFTTSAVWQVPWPARVVGFSERFSGVFTTVHEFGHQYFQGLLASDEFSQPWLDEGMNTFSNVLVLEERDGPDAWLLRAGGLEMSGRDFVRAAVRDNALLQPVDQDAESFDPVVGGYGDIVYRKTAATMLTLRNLVGAERFDDALRTYALRYRFTHPTGADLEATLVETLGQTISLGQADADDPSTGAVTLDVGEFLDQALRTTRELDVRVHSIVNRDAAGERGWHRNESGVLIEDDGSESEPPPPEATVVVQRSGEFVVPVEVEITFADDTSVTRIWSARRRVGTLVFPGRRVARVRLDPAGKLLLESHRLDNHRVAPGMRVKDGLSGGLANLAEAGAWAAFVGFGP